MKEPGKIVTHETITSEDVKPEGRKNGPNNFGPEFTTGPGGVVVPTRPGQQIRDDAQHLASEVRANGGDETEVADALASRPGAQVKTTPASAQPVPETVAGSMPEHEREELDPEELESVRQVNATNEQAREDFDKGKQLYLDGQPLPVGSNEATQKGYAVAAQRAPEQQRSVTGASTDEQQSQQQQ